jgi:hypothetical protein
MRWIIRVTHQDDMALSTICEYVLYQEMLDALPPDLRTSMFSGTLEKMVNGIEEKLTAKNERKEKNT